MTRYEVITTTGSSYSRFQTEISDRLAQGWQLAGGLVVDTDSNYYQAVALPNIETEVSDRSEAVKRIKLNPKSVKLLARSLTSGETEEIKHMGWFEENLVPDFGGKGYSDSYEFDLEIIEEGDRA